MRGQRAGFGQELLDLAESSAEFVALGAERPAIAQPGDLGLEPLDLPPVAPPELVGLVLVVCRLLLVLDVTDGLLLALPGLAGLARAPGLLRRRGPIGDAHQLEGA